MLGTVSKLVFRASICVCVCLLECSHALWALSERIGKFGMDSLFLYRNTEEFICKIVVYNLLLLLFMPAILLGILRSSAPLWTNSVCSHRARWVSASSYHSRLGSRSICSTCATVEWISSVGQPAALRPLSPRIFHLPIWSARLSRRFRSHATICSTWRQMESTMFPAHIARPPSATPGYLLLGHLYVSIFRSYTNTPESILFSLYHSNCVPSSFFRPARFAFANFISDFSLGREPYTFLAIPCTFPFICDSWFLWYAHSVTRFRILMAPNVMHTKQIEPKNPRLFASQHACAPTSDQLKRTFRAHFNMFRVHMYTCACA